MAPERLEVGRFMTPRNGQQNVRPPKKRPKSPTEMTKQKLRLESGRSITLPAGLCHTGDDYLGGRGPSPAWPESHLEFWTCRRLEGTRASDEQRQDTSPPLTPQTQTAY